MVRVKRSTQESTQEYQGMQNRLEEHDYCCEIRKTIVKQCQNLIGWTGEVDTPMKLVDSVQNPKEQYRC